MKVRGKLSEKAREELIRWAEQFDAKPILAMRRKGRWTLESMLSRRIVDEPVSPP